MRKTNLWESLSNARKQNIGRGPRMGMSVREGNHASLPNQVQNKYDLSLGGSRLGERALGI